MIARNLLGSAFLHLAVLVGGGVWYGASPARQQVEPPELVFVPVRPQIEVLDHDFRLEPLEVELSSAEIGLAEPILAENFDPPAAEMPAAFLQPSLAERLWSEALLELIPELAELTPPEVIPAESVESLPLVAYVAAMPLVDINLPPVYPRSARLRGDEGSLRLRVSIDADGWVTQVDLLTPCRHPALNRAAIEALRKWRYLPALRHGARVADSIIEVIVFRISAQRQGAAR